MTTIVGLLGVGLRFLACNSFAVLNEGGSVNGNLQVILTPSILLPIIEIYLALGSCEYCECALQVSLQADFLHKRTDAYVSAHPRPLCGLFCSGEKSDV